MGGGGEEKCRPGGGGGGCNVHPFVFFNILISDQIEN
jgi:hypothetical protein